MRGDYACPFDVMGRASELGRSAASLIGVWTWSASAEAGFLALDVHKGCGPFKVGTRKLIYSSRYEQANRDRLC